MPQVEVSDETYQRIQEDKRHFQNLIGGGEWDDARVIKEWVKILDLIEYDEKKKKEAVA